MTTKEKITQDKPVDSGKKVPEEKPFRILNLTFASKKVFIDFLVTSILIVFVPVVFTAITNQIVKDDPNISELNKVIIAIGPALLWINIVIGVYIYKAIKDPQNYKADEPIKITAGMVKRRKGE